MDLAPSETSLKIGPLLGTRGKSNSVLGMVERTSEGGNFETRRGGGKFVASHIRTQLYNTTHVTCIATHYR